MKTILIKRAALLFVCLTLNLQLSTVSLTAAVLTVTSLADSGPGSLRDQVAASAAGDTIQFAVNGTMLLSSAINISHTLNVQGPGASALVVDANHAGRAFDTSGDPVILSGMTITNGLVVGAQGSDGGIGQNGADGGSAYGGAILDSGISFVLSNCWLVGNVAQGGEGGRGGNNVIGTTYFPPGRGGGGGLGEGGAVYSMSSTVTVVNCTFSDNRAVGGVGGKGGTNVASSLDAGGTGGLGGVGQAGAIQSSSAPINFFINSTFSANRTGGGQGGAGGDNIDSGPGGQGGGGGDSGGGAIATANVSNLRSCTIVSNFAFAGPGGPGGNGTPPGANGTAGAGTAGGIVGYVLTCNNPIASTILADNFASTSFSNYFMAFNDNGHNFIGSDDYSGCPWGSTTQVGTIPMPIHPQLGPLAQNGGGRPTHAPVFGGSPLIVSPVIDAGFSPGLATDERGAPRIYDFPSIPNAPGGDGSDIGAFELGSSDLGLGMAGSNVVLSWPAYYGDFILQSAIGLQGSNLWNNVPDTPVVIGNQFVVTNRMTNAMMFYRLISQ
ncbi:MAG TPA: choice-of-anchor Q domain-containing protein [Verrucomicrobiae bacterium]|nr:choice-of-anchor Q domain-containing protein [Verrucomicrobiae bacterium]